MPSRTVSQTVLSSTYRFDRHSLIIEMAISLGLCEMCKSAANHATRCITAIVCTPLETSPGLEHSCLLASRCHSRRPVVHVASQAAVIRPLIVLISGYLFAASGIRNTALVVHLATVACCRAIITTARCDIKPGSSVCLVCFIRLVQLRCTGRMASCVSLESSGWTLPLSLTKLLEFGASKWQHTNS